MRNGAHDFATLAHSAAAHAPPKSTRWKRAAGSLPSAKIRLGRSAHTDVWLPPDHHFSENRTTAKCVTVEMFAEPGWGEEWGGNVWQMDCVALCAGVPEIIYQPLRIIFQVCERTTAKQSAEPCLRPSPPTPDPISWGHFGRRVEGKKKEELQQHRFVIEYILQ